MITVRLKIGDGEIVDTQIFGFIYLDSDKRVGAESKGFEATAYPEEEGEHILPKAADDAFDYKVKFFIQATSLKDANQLITEFNESLHDTPDELGLKTYYPVTFYNDYKRHKIVGYPSEIPEATDFWRDPNNLVNDIVIVEWTIRVNKPSLCEYNKPF
ncbi:MAG: hypothetical protein IIZ90_00500, partial [Bacteroidales bacterium]|nr:hypothetical protein [Bacteroidales bacterium]